MGNLYDVCKRVLNAFDMYNESKVSNFNIIVDVKDLLEIAKKVEDSLNDENYQSSSRIR